MACGGIFVPVEMDKWFSFREPLLVLKPLLILQYCRGSVRYKMTYLAYVDVNLNPDQRQTVRAFVDRPNGSEDIMYS